MGTYIVGSDRVPAYVESLENGTLQVDIMMRSGKRVLRDIHWSDIMLSIETSSGEKSWRLLDIMWKGVRRGWMLIRHIIERELVGDLGEMVLWWYLKRWRLFGL